MNVVPSKNAVREPSEAPWTRGSMRISDEGIVRMIEDIKHSYSYGAVSAITMLSNIFPEMLVTDAIRLLRDGAPYTVQNGQLEIN